MQNLTKSNTNKSIPNISSPTPAIFFDRDGVVNIDDEYIYKIDDFVYVNGFLELFKECKIKGYLLFVITNQSGIGRGYYTLSDFLKLSDFMQEDLMKKFSFCFDKIYFCAHKPQENCTCRKPKAGMIEQASSEFNIDLASSYIIGDKESDIEAGINAKIGTKILFSKVAFKKLSKENSKYEDNKISKADFIIDNLYKANSIIKVLN
ncbi:MAG: HAD family hydrolase [Helicobacteraceae bacterium]|nr:HAD family hydrolase [Helicobacteraceae bacterium]